MKTKIQKKIKSRKGLLIAPVFKEDIIKIPGIYPSAVKTFIKDRVKKDDFEGKKSESHPTYLDAKGLPEKMLLLGLGKKGKFDGRVSRRLGGRIGKYAQKNKITELSIIIPPEMVAYTGELLEGIKLIQYNVGKHKSAGKKKSPDYTVKILNFVVENKVKGLEDELKRAKLVCDGVAFVKDMVNSPSNIVDADYMAGEARRIAKANKYKIIVLGNKELKKMGWGGVLAVNKGSDKEAKCIVLEYDGAKNKKEKPIVIVGKGVVFDTGGYNLKPTGCIETMHQDMAGGATVLGIFEILKKLNIKRNVIGVIPVVENLINEKAYRPSDIITMFSGKTVEVTNTDAEGRLILADAITYGTRLNPEAIITIATLTGSVVVALGDRYAGLMANDNSLRDELQKAGDEVDELGWPLPLHMDYEKKMNSEIADYKNYDIGTGRYGGSSKAAAFLEKFVGENKWCHIDIGGTAFTSDPEEYQTKGATAHGLRMLLRFLKNRS